jgi:uncharacterized protein (TIGR01777 family)
MRVLVTGSHGLIGSALIAALRARGDEVTRLVRSASPGPGEARWDPEGGEIDAAALEGHDAVVHLAGEGIGEQKWTDEQKRRIMESRRKGTTLLAEAVARLAAKPSVLVSASGINFYGDRGDEELTEESPPGHGFLTDVVKAWEDATQPASDAGIRVVRMRSGIVLDPKSGALGRMLLPFKLGLGGPVGKGTQWWSWIALDDEVGAILHVLGDASLSGPVNFTSPQPVRQREFAAALGEVLHRPTLLPTPLFPLRLRYGSELVRELLLFSQRVLPARLTASGYGFRYPDVTSALRAAVS